MNLLFNNHTKFPKKKNLLISSVVNILVRKRLLAVGRSLPPPGWIARTDVSG